MEDELIDQSQRDQLIRQKYLTRAPGDAATKAYIASKYLSTDQKKRKKKKTVGSGNKVQQHGNIGIVDEDEWGWSNSVEKEGSRKKKKKMTEAQLKSLQQMDTPPAKVSSKQRDDDEEEEEEEEEESRPVIVEDKRTAMMTTQDSKPRMSSGKKAGLLTSKEIQQEAARARDMERKAMERLAEERKRKMRDGDDQDTSDNEDTVYRDSTGRKIDPKLLKAEEARKRKLEIERQERKMEWGKGLVQRNEQEQRRKQLEEETHKPLARYVDDVEYNQGLRDQDRWNDPAAGFLSKKVTTSDGKGKRTIRPKYKGPWKPNRFMIPPGYRWDGVDRSNGYEDQFLLHQNSRKSLAAEAHAWSTEDM